MVPAEIGGKIALVVGGALIGASTAYFVTKRYMENKIQEQFEDRLDNLEASLRDARKALGKEHEKVQEELEERVAFIDNYKNRVVDMGYTGEPVADEITQENFKDILEERIEDKIDSGEAVITVNGEPWTDSSENVEEEESDFLEDPVRDMSKPYPVSFEEWFDANDTMGSMSLTYFEEDGVMIDDREQIVFNSEDLVGTEFDKWFGWKTDGSKDTVYIRNNQANFLYAIEREESSYRDHVLEDIEDDYERSSTRSGVRKMRDE